MIAVKICGLTCPEDARAAVAAGADAIGLVFAPSPRRVLPGTAKAIIAVLPPQVVRVGVFVDQDPDWITRITDTLGLDRLQFHGSEKKSVLRRFPPSRVIRALRPSVGQALPKRDPEPAASAFLVDACVPGISGGTGVLSNWKYARGLRHFGKPIILSGGLNPDNVSRAIRAVKPDMVDVSSGVETKPGIKNAARMRAFVRAVREAGG
ncbi:phosphoribosylanthranilate isomerase [bacterium]|nr:phosphoribosylanthranilate isomerase [bacterium]